MASTLVTAVNQNNNFTVLGHGAVCSALMCDHLDVPYGFGLFGLSSLHNVFDDGKRKLMAIP
eukprot:1639666-Karenia_brevis.AAC.1